MRIDSKGWTAERVREHLHNALYLEMWTVPLYLTAAYSIQVPLNPQTQRPEFGPVPMRPDGKPDFENFSQTDYDQYVFNSVLSVAIQEMLHAELAANVLNAVRPEIGAPNPWVDFTGLKAPDYTRLPPCLNAPLPEGVTLKLGPMDANQARLFQWIEHEDPIPPVDPEAYQLTYSSIGSLYTSLSYGLKLFWSELYPNRDCTPEDLFQKDDWGQTAKHLLRGSRSSGFLSYFLLGQKATAPQATASDATLKAEASLAAVKYQFSIMVYGTPEEAAVRAEAALTAIQVQGEGAGAGQIIPTRYQPTGDPGDAIEIALDRISHWERFTEIVKLVLAGTVQVYPSGTGNALLQQALNESYSSFLVSLNDTFNSTRPTGLEAMRGLGNRTLQVWQSGGLPEYKWSDPQTHFDPSHARDLHACQGLNMCASKGVSGTGTKPGDGDCATAWFHTCSQSNMCAGQGGCGYAGGDPQGDWQPNYNSAVNNGGCGAPIPALQVFSSSAPPELHNKDVWTHARQLMRDKVTGFPTTDPPANALRQLLSATSSKTDK